MRASVFSAALLVLGGCCTRNACCPCPPHACSPSVAAEAAATFPVTASLSAAPEIEDQPLQMLRTWRINRITSANRDLATGLHEAKGDEAKRAEATRTFHARIGAIEEANAHVKTGLEATRPTQREVARQEWVMNSVADNIFAANEELRACLKEAAQLSDPEAAKKRTAGCKAKFEEWVERGKIAPDSEAELIRMYSSK
jgi:hypothetical protein